MELNNITEIKTLINPKIRKGDFSLLAQITHVNLRTAYARYCRNNLQAVLIIEEIVKTRENLIKKFELLKNAFFTHEFYDVKQIQAYESVNGILGVCQPALMAVGFTESQIQKHIQRRKIKRLKRGGNGQYGIIEYSNLGIKYKDKLGEIFGYPKLK